MSQSSIPYEPVNPEPEAVEQEFGEFAAIYAKSRVEAAQALGRETSARQWRAVEEQIESGTRDDYND